MALGPKELFHFLREMTADKWETSHQRGKIVTIQQKPGPSKKTTYKEKKGKIITKKQRRGPPKKTTNNEKKSKASSQKAPTEKPATNKRKNASDQCQKIPLKKPKMDKAGNSVGKENGISASSKEVPTGKVGTNKRKNDQCQKMPPKQPRVDEVSTSIGKEDELSGSSTTNTNKQKPGAASKTNNKGKKASSKKFPMEKADQCQKMPPKQPRVDEVSTSIGKEDELSGVSTTNTNKPKPGAARKTNNKEEKVKAPSKKVPIEKADQCQKMPPKQPGVDEVSASIGKEDESSASSKKIPTKKADQCQKMPPKQPRVDEVSTSIGKEDELSGDDQDLVTQQPSTSGSGRPQFKQGTPSDDELEHLAVKLGGAWKKLGRRLGIKDPKLEEICQSNEALSEKGYQMLRHWKGVNGSAATYQILGQALQTKLVNLRNLAEEFCYEKQQLEM